MYMCIVHTCTPAHKHTQHLVISIDDETMYHELPSQHIHTASARSTGPGGATPHTRPDIAQV